MRVEEFNNPKEKFVEMFGKFLPVAMKVIGLDSLPTFEFKSNLNTGSQPSFGMYSVDDTTLYVALANRHPNDILRTIAHELVHYKQDTEHELNDMSGATGSPEENQANSIAGIVMRNFNKRYPEFLKIKPVVNESAGDRGDIPTGSGEQLIPFPKGTTMIDVSDVYDWYKLGMVISDLDDADPKMFGKGAPHTVIAFGSEEEEHKLLPLLKRLGLSVHDIDRPEDVKQAIPAKMLARDLAETIRKVGSQYRLVSKSGKNLGTYPTHAGAERREKQVQYFKHVGEGLEDQFKFELDLDQERLYVYDQQGGPAGRIEFYNPDPSDTKTIDIALIVVRPQYQRQGLASAMYRYLEKQGYKILHPTELTPDGEKFFGKIKPQEVDAGSSDTAEAYKAHVLKTMPQIMKLFSKAGKGWSPSKEQMLAAVDTGYETMKRTGDVKQAGKALMHELNTLHRMSKQGVAENFADGRNPQDKGDSARHGIRKGMTIAQLKKVRSSDSASPRKKQLAHWQINMRQGRDK